MYKSLGMIALLICLAVLSAAHQQNPSHNQERPTEPASGAGVAPNLPANKPQPKQERSKGSEKMDWFYELIRWPEGITALAIILTLGAIVWQAVETRRAADGAKQAAEAALLNAQAVVNSERARLYFVVDKKMDSAKHGVAIFTIYAINNGRTPAELTGLRGPVEKICKSIGELPIPMPDPPYKPSNKWHVLPDEQYFICTFVPASTSMTARSIELAQESGESINDQERIVCGEVLYKDGISSEDRHSRYCFRFNRVPFSNIGGSLEPCGPAECNDKT